MVNDGGELKRGVGPYRVQENHFFFFLSAKVVVPVEAIFMFSLPVKNSI